MKKITVIYDLRNPRESTEKRAGTKLIYLKTKDFLYNTEEWKMPLIRIAIDKNN